MAYWPSKGPRRVAHRVLANRPIFPCFRRSLPSLVIKPRSRVSESVAREVSRGTNPTLGLRSGRQRRGKVQRKALDGCAINNAR